MDRYIEIELPFWESDSMYVYIRPFGESQLFVAAQFRNDFDSWWEVFHNGKMRESMRANSPILYRLLFHGLETAFEHCALVKLPDPDDGVEKWWLATTVDNVNPQSIETALGDKGQMAILKVAERITLLKKEMLTSEKGSDPIIEGGKRFATGLGRLLLTWWSRR